MAEIYKITNKQNGKCYIRQAVKYLSQSKNKWGAQGRWKSHIREALSCKKDHCKALNNAIRKYGQNSFTIEVICETDMDNIDDKEIQYINHYNSLVPNGYNLKTGGAKGKDSKETRTKKQKMRIGKKHSENVKMNISKGQIGNRRNKKPRKYPEDNYLPKYINAVRNNKTVIAYSIVRFPIGVDSKKYISKSFSIKKYSGKEATLNKAKEYLAELKRKYSYIEEQRPIKEKKISLESKVKNLIEKEKEKLPEHIIPIYNGLKKIGYKVESMTNKKGNKYPSKQFTKCTNRWNLDQAKKYLEYIVNSESLVNPNMELGRRRRNNEESSLPKYINVYRYQGKTVGYKVNGYPINGKKYSKCFGNQILTMEEKLKLACDHLNEIKIKYPIIAKKPKAKNHLKINKN